MPQNVVSDKGLLVFENSIAIFRTNTPYFFDNLYISGAIWDLQILYLISYVKTSYFTFLQKKKRVVSKKSRKVTKAGGGQKKTPQKKTKSKKAAQKKSKSKEKENVAVLGEHELSDLDKD